MRLCTTEGCGRKHYAKNLCIKCYNAALYAANAEANRERARKKRVDSPERVKETGKKYEQSEEGRKKRYERNKKRREANPEGHRASSRNWHAANREESRQRAAEWQRSNPEKVAAIQHRRRARKRTAEGTWTAEDWAKILEVYGTVCPCCGRDGLALTVDHVVPLAQGGTNWPDNLQPLCAECNARKGDRHTTRYSPRHPNQNTCQSSVVEQSIEP